ncbi:cytochrome P450 [Mycena olivaceomarginata]|nr:cytochrome P450 [Mycena olivaceomarginata]
MISQIIVPIAGTLLCYLLFHASQIIYCNLTSPLRHMVGPKNPSFVFGNFKDIGADPNLTNKWRSEFGANFLFSGLSISELHTSDLKAVNHIVARPEIYQKAASNRARILSVELDEHKRHNPAFGVAQIRAVPEIFVEKAVQLRDIWALQAEQQNGAACIEVLSWLRRMTLDVIGQAGFNYQFDALENNGKSNELDEVFTELFHSPQANMYNVFRLSQAIMPILRLMPGPGRNLLRAARNKMYIIGKQIESLIGKRDLLSILLKANLSTTIPETQRLNDTEVISEIPTFFFAGHETTSSATTWALHALSVNTAAQTKLREELFDHVDRQSHDGRTQLSTYLEHVVRETMRVHAPVMFTQRKAMKDDVLPLSKPYIDKEGRAHDSLPIPKGQMIHIPILAINTDKEIWGEDSTEFKPERWEKLPDAVSEIPGVWANLLTFFAGPHNCIGFRFSLVEMKALLFTLIRAFEFQQTRPTVIGEGKGSGLPLIVKPYNMQLYL